MRIRCIDLETTGYETTDHVVEIAAWDLEPETGLIARVSERLVKPPVPIPPAASAVHHITDEDVANAEGWDQIYPMFLDDDVDAYCAHNAKFEGQWLGQHTKKPWVCTLKCAYRIWPDAPTHSNFGLRYWLKPPDLEGRLCGESHRASADAYVTAHTLNLMFKHPKVELKGLIACSSRPALLPKVQFGKHFGKAWKDVPRDYLDWVVGQKDMDEDVVFTAKHHLSGGKA